MKIRRRESRSLKKIVRALELVGVLRIGNGSLPPLLHFLRDWLSPDALSAFSTVSICNEHLLFFVFLKVCLSYYELVYNNRDNDIFISESEFGRFRTTGRLE